MAPSFWDDVLPALNEAAHQTLDGMPESLLEHDGGPYGVKADIIVARLYGLDGEIVKDRVGLDRILPEYLMPIRRPLRTLMNDPAGPDSFNLPTARYVLQSGYVTMEVDGSYAPYSVTVDVQRLQFTVLFLRYRRRL